MKPAFLLFFLIFSQAEYGWLQDVVGIDIKEFEYTRRF